MWRVGGITDPAEEYFKDGLWGWNAASKTWEKLVSTDGKLSTTTVAEAHASSHQDGGSDEISVTGLAGLLVTAQTPAAHKTSHQDAGSDELSVVGLSGLLADDQHVLDAEVVAVAVAKATLTEQGDVFYASAASTPAALAHGTAGQALLTGGHAANPSWGAPAPAAHKSTHAGGGSDKVKYTRQIMWYIPDTTLTTGANKSATIVYRGPTLTNIRWDFRVVTAPTGASLIADVNAGGTSLWATNQANRPTITATNTSGTGTAFDDVALADADVLTIDIDQVGSTIAGGRATLLIEGECNPETD